MLAPKPENLGAIFQPVTSARPRALPLRALAFPGERWSCSPPPVRCRDSETRHRPRRASGHRRSSSVFRFAGRPPFASLSSNERAESPRRPHRAHPRNRGQPPIRARKAAAPVSSAARPGRSVPLDPDPLSGAPADRMRPARDCLVSGLQIRAGDVHLVPLVQAFVSRSDREGHVNPDRETLGIGRCGCAARLSGCFRRRIGRQAGLR